MRKEWLDHAAIRYPYDFDEEGRPTDALRQQLPTTEADKADEQISHEWLHGRSLRRDLLHFVFDEHDCTHRGTCFKGGKAECRASLPEMASEESIIFDSDKIDAIKKGLHDEDDESHRGISDENREKTILWHHLNGDIEQNSQYTILPKRANGSQFLNQHSLPISDVLGCNTNVTLGDPSHTYYTTLYKSKDTQTEDKMAYHRISASMGRRLWRAQQQQRKEEEEREQQTEGASAAAATGGTTSNEDDEQACYIEGLGRVITGVNALLSRDVVSSTMAHLLISQQGDRFTYSHKFSHLLLQNMENVLEEKDGIDFRLRTNRDKTTQKAIKWPDCSAYDYIYRPLDLEDLCLYEYTMWFKKQYKTYKKINNESTGNSRSSSSTLRFAEGHQGRDFCHLTKRKHPDIPIISSTKGSLCNIKLLEVLNDCPSESGTTQLREKYAKTALMLFHPFRLATDLGTNGTYWRKFVDIGGTKKYDELLNKTLDDTISGSQSPSSTQFWNRGRLILENIQTRQIAEKEMKRPNRKITYFTETPKSTGQRKKKGVDKDDGYDMDIEELFADINMDDEGFQAAAASEPRPLADTDLRSHAGLMKRANIRADNVTKAVVDESASVLAKKTRRRKKTSKSQQGDADEGQPSIHTYYTTRYEDLLTFIQGSLLVSSNNASDGDDMDHDDDSFPHQDLNGDQSESSAPARHRIPTLRDIARKYNLDDKQYIAFQVVCCTILLQLVTEGDHYDTKLGEMLGATLNPLAANVQLTKDSVVRNLKAKGAKDHLVMFLTGAAGCGKSTTMEAAQLYVHRFCTAIAVAFNDNTFYFTATTGSAAALFGGTTIHSAAHLNKTRINDEMRAVWRDDVRILIIDEISFFTATDVAKLDRQLKKLTGRYDMVYGGVSIVFSGDFHQLKPICAEDNVLYSESAAASIWENTINCAIFLDNSHRFKDDPLFGEILTRIRMGEDTLADRELINKRVVGSSSALALPENAPDACFACSTNKERNGVTAASFKMHIESTHPDIDDTSSPPDHTLIIEASVSTSTSGKNEKGKKRKRGQNRRKVSNAVHDTIITQLGDDDVRSCGFATDGAKIEPALRIYPGSHHMCITNENLDQGQGNGTLCKCLSVKLRMDGRERKWKNWDGKKVWTASIDSVEWIEFEHYPTPPGKKARTFKLAPQEFSAKIKFPLNEDITVTVGNATVTQVPVNSNIATTGHKLQGMSKDTLIVNSWNYRCANWVYVVLSRVRTLGGLYLMKPLDLERRFNVPEHLIRFEQRLKDHKERPILDMLGYQQQQDNN